MQPKKQEYLEQLFNTDSYEVDELFNLRDKFFGHEESSVIEEDDEPDRGEALSDYDNFIKEYWSLSDEKRLKKLEELDEKLQAFPDLHKRILDLKKMQEDFKRIIEMKNEKKIDKTFIDAFLKILILPSNQQAINKTRYENQYVAGKKNSKLIRTAKLIKARCPSVYRNNKSFMDKIINFRTSKKLEAEKNMTFDWTTLLWGLVFIIWGLTRCI